MARRLASLVAASPTISLPVIRLIQETLLPKSMQVNVAEVLLGGILKPKETPQIGQKPDEVEYRLPKVNRDLQADPSYFKGDNLPVDGVSWHDAVEFCQRLSSYTKTQYRLPSEAEWEYTCRAGTNTTFHFGETITTDLANYNANYTYGVGVKGTYREKTAAVGSFGVANAFGLYDMHGNLWEWCLDDWHNHYNGAPTDGRPWFDDNNNLYEKQGRAVLRGGSWISGPEVCRSASRGNVSRAVRGRIYDDIGFRVACGVGRSS